MESRTDMLARHARELAELAELDSRWWEELFTTNPWNSFLSGCPDIPIKEWIMHYLPTIIRKREKIGVTVVRNHNLGTISTKQWCFTIDIRIAEKLAGRTLAPGERMEI